MIPDLKIKKSTIINFFFILLLGEVFLLIVFDNIPLLSKYYFHCICCFLILLFLQPNVFITKSLKYIYFFIFTYFLLTLFRIYNIDYTWFLREILPLFISMLLYTYFIISKDFKSMASLILISLIFIFISLITSIIGLNKYPLASRDLAGALAEQGNFYLINFYERLGIGGYSFFTGLSFLIPVIIYQIKKNKGWLKVFFIIFLIIGLIGLIKAQFTASLLIALILLILSIGGTKRLKTSIPFVVLFILLIFILPKSFFANIMYFGGNLFNGTVLQNRFNDMGLAFSGDIWATDTHFGARASRIPFLFNEFSKNPILGGGESTDHVFWLDRLSMFGIIGIIPWILIILNQIKLNLKILNEEFRFYYILSMISFIALGFYKNMGGKEMFIIVFFIVPGMNYLQYLKKPQIINNAKFNINQYANR